MGEKIIKRIVGVVITFFFAKALVEVFFYNDFATSIIPGWHSTIPTQSTISSIVALIILLVSLIVVSVYLITQSLLGFLIKKIKEGVPRGTV